MKHITHYYTMNGTKSQRFDCDYRTKNVEQVRRELQEKHGGKQIFLIYTEYPIDNTK